MIGSCFEYLSLIQCQIECSGSGSRGRESNTNAHVLRVAYRHSIRFMAVGFGERRADLLLPLREKLSLRSDFLKSFQ